MTALHDTVEVRKVKVVKLTEAECQKQLQYLKEIQNVVQVYAGEINEAEMHVAIRELIQIGHMIEAIENLLQTAIKDRLYEEALLIDPSAL
jgi:hypothetical protein